MKLQSFVVAMILAAIGHLSAATQTPATMSPAQKMATVDYLVGTWSCAHTVGTFSGTYSTTYTRVLGNAWLKQT